MRIVAIIAIGFLTSIAVLVLLVRDRLGVHLWAPATALDWIVVAISSNALLALARPYVLHFFMCSPDIIRRFFSKEHRAFSARRGGGEGGEGGAISLLVLLIAGWVLIGLIGHDPWKPDEAHRFGIVLDVLSRGDWVVPSLAGEPFVEKPPLFYIVAAGFAHAFGLGLLPPHDAARQKRKALVCSEAFTSFACLVPENASRLGQSQ